MGNERNERNEVNEENEKMKEMKKIIVFCLAFVAFLSSCEINEIHEEYLNVYTQTYTVNKNDWNVGDDDDSGIYLYYEFREPALTQYIYDKGVMQAFLHVKDGNISPLPFSDFWLNGNYQWSQQATCEFRPGHVTFILKYSDHDLTPPYYDNYIFNVRFMW
jgi:hypothetical protein